MGWKFQGRPSEGIRRSTFELRYEGGIGLATQSLLE